jgi:hypothetical protein
MSKEYVGEAEMRLMYNQQVFDYKVFGDGSIKNESTVMAR